MASASPVAIIILIGMVGVIFLPMLWCCLAFWQKKRGLKALSRLSMMLSTIPILSVFGLFYGKEISANFLLIFFSVTPFISLFL